MTSRLYLLALLFALPACPPASNGDDTVVEDAAVVDSDQPAGFHNVTINWQLKNVNGTPMTACPPGFDTIYVNLYRNPDGLVAPPDAEVTLPCTPSGTLTRPVATTGRYYLEDGSYFGYTAQKDFLFKVTEATLSVEAARTSYYYVEELTTDLTLNFDVYPAGGVGVVAWQFSSMLTGAPLASCATAGVDTIEAAIRPFNDSGAPLVVVGSWPCTAVDPYQYYEPNGNGFALLDGQYELGSGTSTGIAAGEYFAELRAKRANVVVGTLDGQVIIEDRNDANPFTPSNITITDR
jgi:hypothetical protein